MRETKFRAWHKKRKKYYKVLHLHIASIMEGVWATCEGYSIIEQKEIHIQIQPQDCISEQFTGLCYKNGKEIFEGDFLEYRDFTSDECILGCDATQKGVVKWIESRCSFNPQEIKKNHKGGNYISYWDFCENIEIIGNIHENPELLK